MPHIQEVLLGGPLDWDVLSHAERALYVVVDDPKRQYSSFYLRIVLAAIIATAGVAADSSTTIIGAMLVAPLMSPMLGTALSAVQARPRAVYRTLWHTLLGTITVLAVSVVVAAIVPVDIGMATNAEVQARISPRLVDLVIALASGFAAALASVRSDIPDAVPGIAISASIVPPLCVAGAGILVGDTHSAQGALLLFGTNYAAIQLAGGLAYALMGLGKRSSTASGAGARAVWYTLVLVAVLLVTTVLGRASSQIVQEIELGRSVQSLANSWAEESGYRISQFKVAGKELFIEVSGSGSAPSVVQLERDLAQKGAVFNRIYVAERQESVMDMRERSE